MSPAVTTISQILAVLTIAGQVGALILVVALIKQKKSAWTEKILVTVRTWWMPLSFIIVVGAFFGSLFYSEIAGFPPCSLCWYQRIFIYPQIILLAGAMLWRDRSIARYVLPLSIIGGIIALYNSYLQYGGSPLIPCGTDPSAIDCAQRLIFEFGYISLPLMSLTAFILLILLAVSALTKTSNF
ncbi:MAG: disulfide bond formation protein B [Candidatus Vogelbacteria bacterium]